MFKLVNVETTAEFQHLYRWTNLPDYVRSIWLASDESHSKMRTAQLPSAWCARQAPNAPDSGGSELLELHGQRAYHGGLHTEINTHLHFTLQSPQLEYPIGSCSLSGSLGAFQMDVSCQTIPLFRTT